MATLKVGSGETYSTLAAAIQASHDGDVIKVAAGKLIPMISPS